MFAGKYHNHVDLVGFRIAHSKELVFGVALPRDKDFSEGLSREISNGGRKRNPNRTSIAVIGEARGNRNRDEICDEHIEYISAFVGDKRPVRVAFCETRTRIERDERGLLVGLAYACDWIQTRIKWMEDRYKERNIRLRKTGSWELSEQFLGDLLWLHRLKK